MVTLTNWVLSASWIISLSPLTKMTSPSMSPSTSATAENVPCPTWPQVHSKAPVWL